jgi:indole-3-glycerol phosphate synthase/phosphoribosylanthranilate isomerase
MSPTLQEIVSARRTRVQREGHTLDESVPTSRRYPVVPFATEPMLVCEVKRRSPSRGAIDAALDPAALARRYRDLGATGISVLTERDHFGGSLGDLMAVKEAAPDLPVLRKDFLLDREDIDIAFRAGADAILLLASVLTRRELSQMLAHAQRLGLAALVEVHDAAEVAKIRPLAPPLTGVNCRDLRTFTVDRTLPARLAPAIDWPTTRLFESGVSSAEDAALARSSGFAGVLVGEAVVRDLALVAAIASQLDRPVGGFWGAALAKSEIRRAQSRPLVKICGITRARDAEHSVRAGADMLGFIFADSPRRAGREVVADSRHLPVLKVGVVVDDPGEAGELLREGLLDALQLQGDEEPDACFDLAFPYYKAIAVADAGDLHRRGEYRCPRVLIDAAGGQYRGGSGVRLGDDILDAAAPESLWLAGGLSPENVAAVVARWRPELIDASSRLEAAPGEKDPAAVTRFFAGVAAANEVATHG